MSKRKKPTKAQVAASRLLTKQKFGQRLRALRDEHNLCQSELGSLAFPDMKPESWEVVISYYENGHRSPSLGNMVRLAKALGVSLSVLVEGEDVE
jgi:transcriptional regulator with XRE-family HTH domain